MAVAEVQTTRRLGARVERDGTRFLVWAPKRTRVAVALVDGPDHPLEALGDGYFGALVPGVKAGQRYWYRLDGDVCRPDPASRFQPEGPFGPSQVVEPGTFSWTDGQWTGVGDLHRQIVYELHIGTFTPGGTWATAAEELARLKQLGVTVLEVMPIAEFAGTFGWGYDGVDLFAPYHRYGSPDDVRRFVDAAHAVGLAVILDVVYNHLGPAGNFLREFSESYFTSRYAGEWGDPINYDGDDAGPVREFFIENAVCWIEEYHFDGLRLDATQAIFDASPVHIVAEISAAARRAARGRRLLIVAENEPQDATLLRDYLPDHDGVDALWNDDFHHSAVVAMTGRHQAYYSPYRGTAQEFVSMARHGFLYQGQWYNWQGKGRGTPTIGTRSTAFVTFLENHDQVANEGFGRRLRNDSHPGCWRALSALLLLGPGIPMLFQGQEYGATTPFRYFADHEPELAALVAKGRAEFVSQFPNLAGPEVQQMLPDPGRRETFKACVLDPSERERNRRARALYRDLAALRASDAVIGALGSPAVRVDGATLGERAFVLRYFGRQGERLLVVNLGGDLTLDVMNEPLLAPPRGREWHLAWSSDDPGYDGCGTVPFHRAFPWVLPAASATLFGDQALLS